MNLEKSLNVENLPIFYRLGTAPEKKFLRQHDDLYKGMVVGAHFLAYFQTSTENFLASLGKPFFIDPMTYVFARPIDIILRETGGLKATFEKLLHIYDTEVANIVLRGRSLTPSDFKTQNNWKEDLIDNFSKNVLEFQRKLLELERVKTLDEILELAELPIRERKPSLLFLVPPYFYAESLSDEWYSISLEIAKRSNQFKGDSSLYPIVCISKQILLSSEDIRRIAEDYEQFDGVVIWISALQDDSDGVSYLRGLARLIDTFKQIQKPVYSLYGGYFFALLSKLGLTGYSSSICYGASKHVERTATGGWVPFRYYMPALRIKVSEINARVYFEEHIDELCQCPICSQIRDEIKSEGVDETQPALFIDRFFKKFDIDLSKRHYMQCRYEELLDISRSGLDDLSSRLQADYEGHKTLVRALGKDFDPSHLRNWAEILSRT